MNLQERHLTISIDGIYAFRRRIPKDLRPYLKKSEIWKTLRTRDYKKAVRRCRQLKVGSEEFFNDVRNKYGLAMKDEFDDISRLVKEFSRHDLEASISVTPEGGLEVRSFKYDPNKPLKEEEAALDRAVAMIVKHAAAIPKQIANNNDKSATSAEHRKKMSTLSLLFEKFCRWQVANKRWQSPTNKEVHLATCNLFLKFFGDKNVHVYDSETSLEFSEKLKQLPKRWLVDGEISKLSYDDVIDLDRPKISESTRSDHLTRINAVFEFAKNKDYCDRNIFDGLMIPKNSKPRTPFTKAELHILYEKPNLISFQKKSYDSHYWAPLLAAWCGIRLAELFQLTTDDVYEKYGILTIDINDKNGKKVKTKNSIRLIPVHDNIREELLIYRDKRSKDRKTKLLFPEYQGLADNPDPGHGFSQAYGRYLQKIGDDLGDARNGMFPEGRGLHAYRHLFIKEMRARKTNGTLSRMLAGHAIKRDTHDNYGNPTDDQLTEDERKEALTELNNAIQKMRIDAYFPKLPTYDELRKECKF